MLLSATTVTNGIFSATGSFSTSHTSGGAAGQTTEGAGDINLEFDASGSNSLYQKDLSEVRVNALFGMYLIRSHEV